MAKLEFQDFAIKTLQIDIDKLKKREKRAHLGLSEVGHECKRYVWYGFRWCYDEFISERILRIFDTGSQAEVFMINSLTHAGYIVTLMQHEIECNMGHGHVLGHIDGVLTGNGLEEPHLLEMKTANDSNFKQISKKGVRQAKRGHYNQMQMYMGKMNLNYGFYMCYNKNDSSYYIEIIKFNPSIYHELNAVSFDTITSDFPPDKIGDATWFECKYCPAKGICHEGEEVSMNCRTCQHINIEEAGQWSCSIKNRNLSTSEQRIGCRQYELNIYLEN